MMEIAEILRGVGLLLTAAAFLAALFTGRASIASLRRSYVGRRSSRSAGSDA